MAYRLSKDDIVLMEVLAYNIYDAKLKSGASVYDSTDFKQWLLECAEEGVLLTEPPAQWVS